MNFSRNRDLYLKILRMSPAGFVEWPVTDSRQKRTLIASLSRFAKEKGLALKCCFYQDKLYVMRFK